MPEEDALADVGTFVLSILGDQRSLTRGLIHPGRTHALHAMITSAGHERREGGGYDWHGLRRGSAEFALFQLTLAGEGRLTYLGETYSVRPGQAMLLVFPDDNRYWLPEGGSWEHLYLCLHGREVMRAWRTAIARRGPLIPLTARSPLVRTAAETVRAVVSGGAATPFTASGLAYACAMALLEECAGDAEPVPRDPRIDAAKAWARAHLSEDFGVDDLARAAGCSRFHFSRLFARSEGSSPAAWVVDLRMRQAARLLRESGLPVSTVADRCGFTDPAYFCRAFRRVIGLSPGEFRSSGMY